MQRARKRFLIEEITKANALSGENGKESGHEINIVRSPKEERRRPEW